MATAIAVRPAFPLPPRLAPRPLAATTPVSRPAPAPRTPVEVALDVLDGRYKPLIVWHLFWGGRPFCELMRLTPGISKKTLRRELVEMERYGLVQRHSHAQDRRRASYALTPVGESLKPVVGALYQWGLHVMKNPLVPERARES
jgi:DNA-binding HxlR family transcriptional regulator